jgi:CHAT domain-containing protein
VLRELGRSELAHIAAHGTFRADNPLFSSLRLADGPLDVHDLERLRRVPRTLVLTACEAGRSGVVAGDELLGTATAFLGLGVATVIAPLLPVPDQVAPAFAVALHAGLTGGLSPAAATAAAAAELRAGGPAETAVAAMFQCIGTEASDTRISPPSAGSLPRWRRATRTAAERRTGAEGRAPVGAAPRGRPPEVDDDGPEQC